MPEDCSYLVSFDHGRQVQALPAAAVPRARVQAKEAQEQSATRYSAHKLCNVLHGLLIYVLCSAYCTYCLLLAACTVRYVRFDVHAVSTYCMCCATTCYPKLRCSLSCRAARVRHVYSLKNINNNRRYIGQTVDMKRRYGEHRRCPPRRMKPDAARESLSIPTLKCLCYVSAVAIMQPTRRSIIMFSTLKHSPQGGTI